ASLGFSLMASRKPCSSALVTSSPFTVQGRQLQSQPSYSSTAAQTKSAAAGFLCLWLSAPVGAILPCPAAPGPLRWICLPPAGRSPRLVHVFFRPGGNPARACPRHRG